MKLIAKNEFHIRWFSPSTWVFFVTVLVVFSIPYLVEIIEFHDVWTFGYSDDIPISPKYFMASMLTWCLLMTTCGAIYLGCNIRVQSIQNRIYEVIESRPITNLELVAGRLLSVIALTSIPVFFALILIFYMGTLIDCLG